MAIVAGNLVAYAALLPAGDPPGPVDDAAALQGGGINLKYQIAFTDLPSADDLEVISVGAETGTLTVTARQEDGTIEVSTGLVPTSTPQNIVFPTDDVVKTINSIQMTVDAATIVTVRRRGAAGDVYAIPAGERGAIRLFRDSASEVGAVARYEKMFWKNKHATLALTTAKIDETTDPDTVLAFALATTLDDTESTAGRKAPPSGGLTFNSSQKNVVGGQLGALKAQGVWMKMDLTAGQAAVESTGTTELRGNTAA